MNKPKLLKATHEGKIKLGETSLNVAVLEDGTRVISANAVFRAFGRVQRSNNRLINMPAFLDAKNLQPFIGDDLKPLINIINYENKGNKEDSGFNAAILPKLCKVYLDARATINPKTKKTILTPKQIPLARASEILLLGLSHLGITALIDEATGYQYEREKDELQKILKAYIAEELLPWEKRFPDEFYREIFRLNNWSFTVEQIKTGSRPGVIGQWTKKYIYSVLPKGVLAALLNKTPRNDKGKLKKRLHQSLTREQGIEHLNKLIISVVTLMNISDDWKGFIKLWNKKFGQQELGFDDMTSIEPTKPKPVKPLIGFDKQLKGLLSVPPPRKEV